MAEPIFKEGQIVWRCTKNHDVVSTQITEVQWINTPWELEGGHFSYHCGSSRYYFDRDKGKTVFETREEAENKADRDRKIETKRLLLEEYEEEVNKILELEDHFLVRKHKGE